MKLKGGNSPVEQFYRRCVAWSNAEGLTKDKDGKLGRWSMSVIKYPASFVQFVWRNTNGDHYWLFPVPVAINGIDGEVYEPRWSNNRPIPDEGMMEILMLMPPWKDS